MSADEDKKFDNKEELKDWLKTRGVDEDKVADAAEKLLARGFNRPSKLLCISVDTLVRQELGDATAMHLFNKLKEQQQQQQQQQHTVTYSNNDNSTSMSADEDKKFDNKEELKDWLKTRGVDEDDVAEAAEKLFARGFNKPSKLLGITVEEFAEINKTMSGKEDKFSVALIRHLHNKLKEQQQQQVSTCVRRFRCSREIIRAGWFFFIAPRW